jgi:hypothetical protein
MNKYEQIASRIIKEQELVIGPLAWNSARKVQGLRIVDQKQGAVSIENPGDSGKVVDGLVGEYEHLFGRASKEVCKEAVAGMIADFPKEEIPISLR